MSAGDVLLPQTSGGIFLWEQDYLSPEQFLKYKLLLRVERGRQTDGQLGRQADRVTESDSFHTPLQNYSKRK